MAAVAMVGCSFCLDVAYFQAHKHGRDEAKAREVPRWRESPVFSALERDTMEYAEAMTATPPRVTDELSARLLEQLGAPAMVAAHGRRRGREHGRGVQHGVGNRVPGVLEVCVLPLARPSAGFATPT